MVFHLWTYGACFVFDCYPHWQLLVSWNQNGTDSFLNSGEGVTQEEPLDMVAYGIGVICMMKQLKETYPDVTKPWYVDDEGALGTYDNIELYFNSLRQSRTGCGYYLEPSKIVLIVNPDNIETGKQFGLS